MNKEVAPERLILNIQGAFVRRTDLSYANLEDANLSKADATNAIFRGANFKNANLKGTILRGADLSGARNLTIEQLREAITDDSTILPSNLTLASKERRTKAP